METPSVTTNSFNNGDDFKLATTNTSFINKQFTKKILVSKLLLAANEISIDKFFNSDSTVTKNSFGNKLHCFD